MICRPVNLTALAAVAAAVAVLSAFASPAAAQDDPIQKILDLNKRAIADYEGGDFDSAKLGLLEAIGVATKAGLSSHRAMARTYVNLAAVYVNGFNARDKGVRYLGMALKIQPDVQLTNSLITPPLREAFAMAGGKKPTPVETEAPKPAAPSVPAGPTGDSEKPTETPEPVAPSSPPARKRRGGPEEPDLPASIPQPLYCPNPDEAPPSTQIALRCVVQPELAIARVLLFYRLPGGEKFTLVPTLRSPKGWFNGIIPAAAVEGKSLQYYFEARDASDKVAASSGRNDSPNLIIIKEGAPPVGKGSLAMLYFQKRGDGAAATEENPLEAIENEKAKQEFEGRVHRRAENSLWFGFGLGTGYGYHPKEHLEFRYKQEILAGVNPAGTIHFAPEVGYQMSDRLSLSLQVRVQYIRPEGSGDDMKGNPALGAVAGLARAMYAFGEGNLQFFLAGAIGGGDGFRLVIPPKPKMGVPRNDTVRGGPIVAGPSFGILYHFNRSLALAIEVRGLLGFPTFAAVADGTLGVQYAP